MTEPGRRRPRGWMTFGVWLVAGLVAGLPTAAWPEASTVPCDGVAAAAGGGMKMYRDPATGEIGVPPAGLAPDAAETAAQRAEEAEAPLTEEPAPGRAGGVKVNLRGRFRPVVVRRAESSGPATHECVTETGGSHADE